MVFGGDLGESNSRSLAPKASIIPLDQSPLTFIIIINCIR